MKSHIEICALGEMVKGSWYAVPACLMGELLQNDCDVEEFLDARSLPLKEAFTIPSVAVSDNNGQRYFPATPPVLFTFQQSTLDEMRERVREGEDESQVMMEFYANGHIEVKEEE